MLKAILSFSDMCAYMHQMDSTDMSRKAVYMKHEQVLFIKKTACISDFTHKLTNSL